MRLIIVLLTFVTLATTATAGPLRRRTVLRHRATTYTLNTPLGPVSRKTEHTTIRGPGASAAVIDALAEVNAKRAARGLPGFVADPALTQAAQAAAAFRATNRIEGHTSNDVAFLPPGSAAHAAVCAAIDSSWGFLSCCQWERWTYAGAASVVGSDGKVYHHLFVR